MPGDICPAISIAVKNMRKGEEAELSVKFSCKLQRMFKKTCVLSLDFLLVKYSCRTYFFQMASENL